MTWRIDSHDNSGMRYDDKAVGRHLPEATAEDAHELRRGAGEQAT